MVEKKIKHNINQNLKQMKENEYIKAKALGTITAAINTLRDLVPSNLTDIISEEEYKRVMPTLYSWQDRLYEQLEIEEVTDLKCRKAKIIANLGGNQFEIGTIVTLVREDNEGVWLARDDNNDEWFVSMNGDVELL